MPDPEKAEDSAAASALRSEAYLFLPSWWVYRNGTATALPLGTATALPLGSAAALPLGTATALPLGTATALPLGTDAFKSIPFVIACRSL